MFLICESIIPCVVNSSIRAVLISLAVLGVHNHAIFNVDLQREIYLHPSVSQVLVSIDDSYLVTSASRNAIRHSSWVYYNIIWVRSPVVSSMRKLPIRYCNCVSRSTATRWSSCAPWYLINHLSLEFCCLTRRIRCDLYPSVTHSFC
jgi:hypothetical protein